MNGIPPETNHKTYINLAGNIPMIDLSEFTRSENTSLYAKCEFMNPGFSMKDRIASYILDQAEEAGDLKSGDTIVCASSGNTGCSIAMQGNIRGYRVIIVTSEKCSLEKQNHIRALNAELKVVSQAEDYMAYGKDLAEDKGYFDVDQYNNAGNPEAYYHSLGPEIWEDTRGLISHFVMTGSTYGCISGTAKFLKEQNKDIQVILVDPEGSNIHDYFYNAYRTGARNYTFDPIEKPSLLEGVGKERPTGCLEPAVIDKVDKVSDQAAIEMCHRMAAEAGLMVGGSSGLNVAAAVRVTEAAEPDSVVVTILCDSGVKYLSKIYNPDYLAEQGIRTNHG
uniref:cysteine synthase n=1 Tax=Candidatus Kentrum eta TaxID=2126337 RepID=A0A450UE83_9GAMM|nr:MAG: cysteine synthase A [Candidatus Kentron sp. H]VFJ91886.1 MAG: cysteine synthase A [Candidatus Kentron sp. H]VFJ98541.1 MAG: cysteine synthase A [Candidatus Kentron sp. H]